MSFGRLEAPDPLVSFMKSRSLLYIGFLLTSCSERRLSSFCTIGTRDRKFGSSSLRANEATSVR